MKSSAPETAPAGHLASAGAQGPASERGEPNAPPVDSNALLRGGKSVEIRHLGTTYRLQATKLGKLILTK